MKKKIFSGVFALVILLIAGYGVNRSMNSYADLSDLALKNVHALARIENPDPGELPPIEMTYVSLTLDCFNKNGVKIGTRNACYSPGISNNCIPTKCP